MCGQICLVLLIAGVFVGANAALSSNDQNTVVNTHNELRGNVKPPAADMKMMSWHDGAAKLAEDWAKTCKYGHNKPVDEELGKCGQNVYKIEGKTSEWSQVVKKWHSEVKDFKYGAENDFMSIGHYTQVVWSDSNRVGCGYANCGKFHLYVCNYCPQGNYQDRINRPYKKGTKCESCPKSCKNGLCV